MSDVAVSDLPSEAAPDATAAGGGLADHLRGNALAYAALAVVFAAQIIAICSLTGGTFVYTLDDAYIHLRVSERIAAGSYGINPGEVAAPASSVLWPILLAPFAPLGIHRFVPLVLTVGITFVNLGALLWLADRVRFATRPIARLTLALAFILFLDLTGLAVTGLEHSLHTLVVLAAVCGTVRLFDEDRVPWWFVTALVLAPLVRYEGLAVTAVGVVVLAVARRRRAALGVALGAAAGLGAFTAFLAANGLGVVPSSVRAKSAAVQSGGVGTLARVTAEHAWAEVSSVSGVVVVLAVAVAATAWAWWLHRRGRLTATPVAVGAVGAAVLGAHLLFGNDGNFRYEVYALTGAVAALTYVLPLTVRTLTDPARLVVAVVAVGALLAGTSELVDYTRKAPGMARNNYDQQYQTARFVHDWWRRPVAVNDLGLVSYRSDEYVLDLFGLASVAALDARAAGEAGWMERLTAESGVDLAVIYDTWFDVPDSWIDVGTMTFTARNVVAGNPTVHFYATSGSPDDARAVAAALDAFAPTLPEGVSVSIDDRWAPAGA